MGDRGTILATGDGTSWELQASNKITDKLNSIYFPDANHGWTVGWGGAIFATSNGGISWASQTSNAPMALNGPVTLSSVFFADATRGWAVGDEGTILATDDAGKTWKLQHSGIDKGLESVDFVDVNQGWAVGEGGTILATRNGGANWDVQRSGTPRGLRSVCFVDAKQGWTVDLLFPRPPYDRWRYHRERTSSRRVASVEFRLLCKPF